MFIIHVLSDIFPQFLTINQNPSYTQTYIRTPNTYWHTIIIIIMTTGVLDTLNAV